VEARSRDIQLDDGDYFKIIIALCQNKMAAQAQVPYLSPSPKNPKDFGKILQDLARRCCESEIQCFLDSWILVCFLRISDPLGNFWDYKYLNFFSFDSSLFLCL
jgi:hypothetical protein